MAAHGTGRQCQTGLRPPPDEQVTAQRGERHAEPWGERGETGVYDGKTEPLGAKALRAEPSKQLIA